MRNRSKWFVVSAAVLVVLQIVTILSSWVVSAVFPSLGIRSLLSNEGLRWLLSSFPQNVSSRILVWMLFISVIIGLLRKCGFSKKIIGRKKCDYREKFALKIFFLEIFVSAILCIVLAVYPHSPVLGVTGHLFPGPFAFSVLLILCCAFIVASFSYLLLSGMIKNYEDAGKALVFGLQDSAPLIVIYFLLKEWIEMLRYLA